MKIITWNINWIRASVKRGFVDIVKTESPDILCLQEIKSYESQIPPEVLLLSDNYNFIWNPAKKPWYAWTAVLYKKDIQFLSYDLFSHEILFSQDGRVIETRFHYNNKEYVLLNLYFPNWNTRTDGTEMLSHKLKFYDTFLNYINELKKSWLYVICAGDFNVAHKEIDLANPKQNKRSVWFLLEERAKLDIMHRDWFVDLFRHYYPDSIGHYTRWSYRTGMREANKWWRYDYIFISENTLPNVKKLAHLHTINASDHCPISLLLK